MYALCLRSARPEYITHQKGFGPEVDGMQRQLEDFFNKYGKANAVRMRRIETSKEFKVRNGIQTISCHII